MLRPSKRPFGQSRNLKAENHFLGDETSSEAVTLKPSSKTFSEALAASAVKPVKKNKVSWPGYLSQVKVGRVKVPAMKKVRVKTAENARNVAAITYYRPAGKEAQMAQHNSQPFEFRTKAATKDKTVTEARPHFVAHA